ncbi:MAG: alpha/beta hydrolase [Bdellovibrionota bacterium]
MSKARLTIAFLSLVVLLGCSGLNRAEHNKTAEALPHPLFVRVTGSGPPIVFLHGLASSNRYWDKLIERFEKTNTIVAPDLLGFGRSPWPDIDFTVADHLAALTPTIEQVIGNKKAIVVGHSLGAILALDYAIAYPDRVDRLILLSPPHVNSREDLEERLSSSSMFESVMAMNSFVAPLACWFHESVGAKSVFMFRPFIRDLPEAVIEDVALHTWRSYNGSLEHLIIRQRLEALLEKTVRPVVIIVARFDRTADADGIAAIGRALNVPVRVVDGEHNFLVQDEGAATGKVYEQIIDGQLPQVPVRAK